MTYRSRALLDLAHYIPCRAEFPHDCNGWHGCEPAHSDSHIWGRGAGHKSHDFAFAAICHNAHRMLSAQVGSDLDREQKEADWLRAYVATWEWIWEHQWVTVQTAKAKREGICA